MAPKAGVARVRARPIESVSDLIILFRLLLKFIEIGIIKSLLLRLAGVIPAILEDVIVQSVNGAIAVEVREICGINKGVAIRVLPRNRAGFAPIRPQPRVVRTLNLVVAIGVAAHE